MQPLTKQTSMNSLCAACAAIDFSTTLAVAPAKLNRFDRPATGESFPDIVLDANADRLKAYEAQDVLKATDERLITTDEHSASDSSCPLCPLLKLTLCPGETEWSDPGVRYHASLDPYILKAYSFALNCPWVPEEPPKVQDCHILLAVRGVASSIGNYSKFVKDDGYVVCLPRQESDKGSLPKGFCVPRLIDERFDAERAKSWIANCKSCHERCEEIYEGPLVQGMKVIDVVERGVVPAKQEMAWVALSYVWGDRETDLYAASIEPDQILQSLPKSIEDAIKVTRDLGYRYLWIDRYCIDQTDAASKHTQLQQMDEIYRGAELTIIAACGENGDYGLPGVSTTLRKKQPVLELEHCTILSTGPNPVAEAKKARWWRRGWTLQEGIFSRRRLFFTDFQSFFECSCGCMMEALGAFDVPGAPEKLQSTSKFTASLTNRFLVHSKIRMAVGNSPQFESVAAIDQYIRLAREYTKRNLTFDSDSLVAFAGLSNYMSGQQPKVVNMLGIPYVLPTPEDGQTFDLFIFSLCWFHGSDVSPHRRTQFPSWTWAGWAGNVEWMTRRLDDNATQSKMRNVRLQRDGTDVSVEDYVQDFDYSNAAVSESNLVLCFEAREVPSTLFMLKEEIDWGDSEGDDGHPSSEESDGGESLVSESLPGLAEAIEGQPSAEFDPFENQGAENIELPLSRTTSSEINKEGHLHGPPSPMTLPEDISLPSSPILLPAPDANLWSSYTVGPHTFDERLRFLDISPLEFLDHVRAKRWSCLLLADYDGNGGFSHRRFMLVVEWINDISSKGESNSGSNMESRYARRVGAVVIKRRPYVDNNERDFFVDDDLVWREVMVV